MTQKYDFEAEFAKENEKFRQEIQKPSILVLGGTGVGKSTLINLVFKKEIAITGAGKPVTKGIHKYENDFVTIYDSEGYEVGVEEKQLEFNKLIEDFIECEQNKLLVWFCISAPSARVTDLDIELIRGMRSKGLPVAAVFTQVDIASDEQINELKHAVESAIPGIKSFESSIDETILTEGCDLNALHDWSINNLSEAQKTAFIFYANRDFAKKEEKGKSIVYQQAVASATIGAMPIPGSDAPILIGNQTAMLVRLFSLWDIETAAVLAGLAVETMMPMLGRTLAGNIIKCIPGIGTAAGAAINSAVAGSLTFGLGMATNMACRKIAEARMNGEHPDIMKIFEDTSFLEAIKMHSRQYKK